MSRADQAESLRVIEGQARIERQAFARSLNEVSERLRPRALVDSGTRFLKRKAGRMLGDVSETVKANGGSVALAGAGALLAFEIGRGSVGPRADASLAHGGGAFGEASKLAGRSPRKVSISAKAKAIATWGGGLLLGNFLGKGMAATAMEKKLFEKTSATMRQASVAFVSQHSRGAKVAAAQAFGFANYAAALLAVMAAVGMQVNGSAGPARHVGDRKD